MYFVKPSVELLDIHDPLLKLERCMRVCYKSEDKICEGSAEKIVRAVVKRGHTSTLEHFRIRILCSGYIGDAVEEFQRQNGTAFIHIFPEGDDAYDTLLVGNLRAFKDMVESEILDVKTKNILLKVLNGEFPDIYSAPTSEEEDWEAVKYDGEDTEYMTVHIVTDRGVLQEIARNRTVSPSAESTRYCNYGFEKRGISICLPEPFLWSPCETIDEWVHSVIDTWYTFAQSQYVDDKGNVTHAGIVELSRLAKLQGIWETSCAIDEAVYNQMLQSGAVPQEARAVLPNSLKAELMLTGTFDAWQHFIKLRAAKDAQPQIQLIAEDIQRILDKKMMCIEE